MKAGGAAVAAAMISAFLIQASETANSQVSARAGQAAVKVAQVVTNSLSGVGKKTSKLSNVLKRSYRKVRDLVSSGSHENERSADGLAAPKDHCPLPRDSIKDLYDKLEEVIGPEVTPIQYSMPCNALPDFWSGKGTSSWSVYTVSKATMPADASRTSFVVEMTKSIPQVKFAELGKLAKQKPPLEKLGLVEASPDAVYVASLSNDEDNGSIAHIGAFTILNRRVIGLNVYAKYEDKVFEHLLSTAKDVVGRSIAMAVK